MSTRPSWYERRRKPSYDYRSKTSYLVVTRRLSKRSILSLCLTALFILAFSLSRQITDERPLWSSWAALLDYDSPKPAGPLKLGDLPSLGEYSPRRYLKGPPTKLFRDNLLDEYKYITGWIGGGWTNDWMTYINLIYLAKITDRIPIMPPFAPTHVGRDVGFVPFGDVFDIPRMANSIHLPILEWRDVKLPAEPGDSPETLGGWTVWARWDHFRGGLPRHTHVAPNLSIEVSYTNVPWTATMRSRAESPDDEHVMFNELSKLSYHSEVVGAVKNEINFESDGPLRVKLPPDEHIMTFDFLYFATLTKSWEWGDPWYLPWNMIGTHCHWHPNIERLAHQYLMRLFGVDHAKDIPRYISIHARRKDFVGMCDDRPKAECFAPLTAYNDRVQEILREFSTRPEFGGSPNLPVVMTSDETDQSFWDDVKAYRWLTIDHGPKGEDTAAMHGPWYPVFVDAAIQSMAHGFIGTGFSTMSMIAGRRVEDWQRGVSRDVTWGKKDSDKHDPQYSNKREHQYRFT